MVLMIISCIFILDLVMIRTIIDSIAVIDITSIRITRIITTTISVVDRMLVVAMIKTIANATIISIVTTSPLPPTHLGVPWSVFAAWRFRGWRFRICVCEARRPWGSRFGDSGSSM